MKGATVSLILGTVLIALSFLGITLERPGLRPDIGLLEAVAESFAYSGFAFLVAGITLVTTGLLFATRTAVERRRRATAEAIGRFLTRPGRTAEPVTVPAAPPGPPIG